MSTKRVLYCSPVLPEYDRESGSRRLFHTIEFLRQEDWAVTYVAEQANGGERYVRALQQAGVATYVGFDALTEQFLVEGDFDLAIFAFWYVAERFTATLRRVSPRTRIVVDSIDLHFLRDARRLFRVPTPNSPAPIMYDSDALLKATPNPVPATLGPGATTLVWKTGRERYGQLYVSVDGAPERLVAQGREGTLDITWIENSKLYKFRLYASQQQTPLAEMDVTMSHGLAGLDLEFASAMMRELNTYAAVDGVLTVSQVEAGIINSLVGDSSLASTVPDCDELPPSEIPLQARTGILFVGNFRHPPNVDAVEYFCSEVVPRIDPKILAMHPVSIVGNGLNEAIVGCGEDNPYINMIGWVPSVLPYLHRARVSVAPLRYGAGTKRKVIQSLMVGTPTVSTTIGIEGLNLCDRKHILVADDPVAFAEAITELVQDDGLYRRIAGRGRSHITAIHSREAVQKQFHEIITAILARNTKIVQIASLTEPSEKDSHYQELKARIHEIAATNIPPAATALVVSKGDDDLLKLDGRTVWHFPQNGDGEYAGYYPADSTNAIASLEALRAKGVEYLLFPSTAMWWLDYYREFKQHLDNHYQLVVNERDSCLIFALNGG